MSQYKVLIVDDERLAREEVKQALKNYEDFMVVAEASNADDAEEMINKHAPDVLFLDIQMPERNGLDLLESIDHEIEVIFITAFDQFAVKAFELEALDYLVKPVRFERFQITIDRLRERLTEKSKRPDHQRFFIREGDRFFFIYHNDVSLIESSGNYVRLHANNKKHYLKRSLNQMEELLDKKGFFRINRTEIVNLSFIKSIKREEKGKLILTLKDGTVLEVSGRRSAEFRNRNIPLT